MEYSSSLMWVGGSARSERWLAMFARSSTACHRSWSRPYALCVTLFNVSRRLVLRAYCVVIGGIPAHNGGILDGSRNCTQCRFIFTRPSRKRRYSACTSTSTRRWASLLTTRLLVTYRAPASRHRMISQRSSFLVTRVISHLVIRVVISRGGAINVVIYTCACSRSALLRARPGTAIVRHIGLRVPCP